jgi:hypothetical protein
MAAAMPPGEGSVSEGAECDVKPLYSCVVKFNVKATAGEAKLLDEEVRA